MKPLGRHNYFVYITTSANRRVLYTGITNDLKARLYQHKQDTLTEKSSLAGKYNCIYLVCWERHSDINHEIEREKEIKGWLRTKKEDLIRSVNPDFRFLNDEVE